MKRFLQSLLMLLSVSGICASDYLYMKDFTV